MQTFRFIKTISAETIAQLKTYNILTWDRKQVTVTISVSFKNCTDYCFASSPRRPYIEDKRMVLEHTHGLFIT